MYSIWSRLRKRRIVISETSREKLIDIAYISPMGIVKTKVLIHEEVWFPKICRLVEEKVKSFLARLVTTPRNGRKLLQMFESPKASWTELSIDFGLVPTHCNEYLPVLINEYCSYQWVWNTWSSAVRQWSFYNREFNEFAKHLGFVHRKVTPYWPLAYGEVERFMRAVMESKEKSHNSCVIMILPNLRWSTGPTWNVTSNLAL